MTGSATLGLFDGVGLELEYMIVDAEGLDVRPISDELLRDVAGEYVQDVDLGAIGWSNELALHVVEIKNIDPVPSLGGQGGVFQEHVGRINHLLEPYGARLLPTAMHPWMNPDAELKLWPHGNRVIYSTLNRIFDCRGHGWANLQSVHLNLPFADDEEFGRLHAAIRLVLPLIPALAASSPFIDGRLGTSLDTRLEVYRSNAARVPSVAGKVIPEAVFSRREYETKLLQRIYDDLAPLDPEGVVRYEWVNSRGCIARFDRMAIEIRVTDVQEHPQADVAVAAAVTAAIRALVEEQWCSNKRQRGWHEDELLPVFLDVVREADDAVIENTRFIEIFGAGARPLRAGELWQHIIENTLARQASYAEWESTLTLIRDEGCLSRRIVSAAGQSPTAEELEPIYGELAACLAEGKPFRAPR